MTLLTPPLLITTIHGNLLRNWQAVPRVGDWIDLPFTDVDELLCSQTHRVVAVEWSEDAVKVMCHCVGEDR